MSQAEVPTEQTAAAPAAGRSLLQRVLGALRLDASVYDEIAADPGALAQAAGVAAAAGAARALSAPNGAFSLQGLVWAALVFAFWPATSALVWGLGKWFGHPSDFGRMLRACGFAMAPFLLLLSEVLPIEIVRVSMAFLSTALLLGAFIVAVRQVLGVSTGRAAFVFLLSFATLIFFSMVTWYLQIATT
jgi:hypothetical protein